MKVLVVRVGAMGDVLHTLPAVAALRRAQPEWVIDWVVHPRWASLLVDGDEGDAERAGPVVTQVVLAQVKLWKTAPWSLKTLRSVLALRRQLREQRYDVVVDMQGTIRSAVIGWLAGARAFVGYSDPREPAAARFYSRRVHRAGVHIAEQGASLLAEATGVALSLRQPDPVRLQPNPMPAAAPLPRLAWAEDWAESTAVLARPLCVLGAGGGWGAKLWPAERFGELASALRAMGFDVAVNAHRLDDPEALQVVESSAGAARMVICNVAGLTALLRRADLFVGGDTGPTHLAAALAVPTVALFGPTDPARNGPWGPGLSVVLRDPAAVTSYKRSNTPDAGLARMTVEQVVAAVQQITHRPGL